MHSRQKIGRDLAVGRPRITWMKTVLNDLESLNLTLTEAVSMPQNRPLWSGCEWCYALMVVLAKTDNDDDDDDDDNLKNELGQGLREAGIC